jgi:hypothetical protein
MEDEAAQRERERISVRLRSLGQRLGGDATQRAHIAAMVNERVGCL